MDDRTFASSRSGTEQREFSALGTTVTVATTCGSAIDTAESILRAELNAIDRACSRFRVGSEISRANLANGYPVVVSRLLTDVISSSLRVAAMTDGAVDPTVGSSLIALGYDRDFDDVLSRRHPTAKRLRPARGWRCIEFDARRQVLRIPKGVVVDLGATAKAFAADRAAERIAEVTGSGVLVNLGGDIAIVGRTPKDGWSIGLALACTTPPEDVEVVVAVHAGGIASSGTAVRAWRNGDREVHHIIDPTTGNSADTCWQLVTVAAPSCVDANAASTGAIVWAAGAVDQLGEMGLPSRLLRHDGSVVMLNGWPEDPDGFSGPKAKAA